MPFIWCQWNGTREAGFHSIEGENFRGRPAFPEFSVSVVEATKKLGNLLKGAETHRESPGSSAKHSICLGRLVNEMRIISVLSPRCCVCTSPRCKALLWEKLFRHHFFISNYEETGHLAFFTVVSSVPGFCFWKSQPGCGTAWINLQSDADIARQCMRARKRSQPVGVFPGGLFSKAVWQPDRSLI